MLTSTVRKALLANIMRTGISAMDATRYRRPRLQARYVRVVVVGLTRRTPGLSSAKFSVE